MTVPLIDVNSQHRPIKKELSDAIARVIETGYFILGPEVEALEEEIAEYSNTSHAIGVSSGTDALLVSMMALDLGPDDYVITTPLSFVASMSSIV